VPVFFIGSHSEWLCLEVLKQRPKALNDPAVTGYPAMLLIALQRFDEILPGIQHKHKKEAEWEADYLIHRVVYGLAFLGSDFPLACRNSNKWFAGHPEYAHHMRIWGSRSRPTPWYTLGIWAKHGS
jgi:hypothetical protein